MRTTESGHSCPPFPAKSGLENPLSVRVEPVEEKRQTNAGNGERTFLSAFSSKAG
jgi:hypothetical protein